MKPLAKHTSALLVLAFLPALALIAQSDSTGGRTYKSGYSNIMKLGKDIHNNLKPAHREQITAQTISIETDPRQFVRLLYYNEEPRPIRGVWISAGFIDLVNNVAHAEAIDQKEKGYFN